MSFYNFFEQRKVAILLPVLMRDFSPLGELLQVYTATENDISINAGLYRPRKVIFKRFAGDSGLVLAHTSQPQSVALGASGEKFAPVVKGYKLSPFTNHASNTVVLSELDLDAILGMCQLVRKWEALFPQMRWFHRPERCRILRTHELVRFRRALYRWWLYGIYFHGEFRRPRVGHPEPLVDDIRTSQMRRHCTGELLELMDFLETIKDVILHYICPRLEPDQLHVGRALGCTWHNADSIQSSSPPLLIETVTRSQSLASSWNDQSLWGRIIKTYAKLGPKELLHYFDNICSYPRQRLICAIRLEHPSFTLDQESIQVSIRCALDERRWQDGNPRLADDVGGGIVDFDDERDAERLALEGDASPDGSLPPGLSFVQTFSRYSPRGDDGSSLESHQRLAVFGSHHYQSTALDAAG